MATESETLFEGMLTVLEPNLYPGAIDKLRIAINRNRPPEQVAAKLIEHLTTGPGRHWHRLDLDPADSLGWLASAWPGLAAGSAQRLHDDHKVELGRAPVEAQARALVSRFRDRDFASRYLAVAPAPDAHVTRVRETILGIFSDIVPLEWLDAVATEFGRDLRGLSGDDLVQALARRFAAGHAAHRFPGVANLDRADPRMAFRSAVATAATQSDIQQRDRQGPLRRRATI